LNRGEGDQRHPEATSVEQESSLVSFPAAKAEGLKGSWTYPV